MIANIVSKFCLICFPPLRQFNLFYTIPSYRYSSTKPPLNQDHSRKGGYKQNVRSPSSKANNQKQVHKHSNQSNSEVKLWHIMRNAKKVIDGVPEVDEAISICCSITAHYHNSRNIGQFKVCKGELERLLNSLTSLPFKDFSLQNYFMILQFLAVIQTTQQVKRHLVVTLKDIIFLGIQPALQSLPSMSLSQLAFFYARLAPFNHPQLSLLAEQLQSVIAKLDSRFDVALVEAVMVGLNQRKFLSSSDIKIIKVLFQQLEESSSQLSLLSLARIFHASESMSLSSIFGDNNSLVYLLHLQKVMVPKIRAAGIADPALIYLASAEFRSIRSSAVFQEILEKVVKSMEEREINGKMVQILIGSLQRMVHCTLTPAQVDTIITYLLASKKSLPARAVVFSKESLQISVLQLIQTGAFDAHLDKFDQMINMEHFEPQWSIIADYSIKNHSFPLRKIEPKIKPKTTEFKEDGNFLKAAVSIGIQLKYHPQSAVLKKAHEEIIVSLASNSWGEQQLEWLGRLSTLHPQLLRAFHSLYNAAYFSKLQPYAITHNPRYYHYFIACENSNCSKEAIRAIPLKILQALLERQLRHQKQVNAFLLFIVHHKFQVGLIDIRSTCCMAIVRLLLHYSQVIHTASEESVQNFHNLMMQVLHFYKDLKALTIEFNLVLKRMLACPNNSKYYGSSWHKILVNDCLKKYINHVADADLTAIIIRCAIGHKELRSVLATLKVSKQYFSQLQLQTLPNLN